MTEYFTYTQFNTIETGIDTLTDLINAEGEVITPFSPKTWASGDFTYIQEVDRIEVGMQTIATYLSNPTGYVYKEWLSAPSTSHELKSYSWDDYQRWLTNLEVLNAAYEAL